MRWLQATVFSSHIRLHGIGEREPWAFGAEAEAIARKWLAFRYRLIPVPRARDRAGDARPGLPVMRAMPLAFPGNALARALRDAVHVRRRAARRADRRRPAAKSRSRCRRARGTTSTRGSASPGGRCCAIARSSTSFPVFGREGHALPLGRAVQHTGEIDIASAARAAVGVRRARRTRSTASRRRDRGGAATARFSAARARGECRRRAFRRRCRRRAVDVALRCRRVRPSR